MKTKIALVLLALVFSAPAHSVNVSGFGGAVVGNADTATALASNPTDCGSNQFANAIAASGNLSCSAINNAATTATDANTGSAIVARDGSGNFSAGTITASLTGAASLNVLKTGADTISENYTDNTGAIDGTAFYSFISTMATSIPSGAEIIF